MRLLDLLLGRTPPVDVPLAALVERNQKVLDAAEAELQRHEKVMVKLLVASYEDADRAFVAIRRGGRA